jgi:glycine betaine catabolism A
MTAIFTRNVAPIDQDGVAQALLPFGQSTVLPVEAYTDPELFRWEQRHAFAGSWFCIGRDEELLPDGATGIGLTVGDVPVLLTRKDGVLRALANTCSHRGHELIEDGSTSRTQSLVCPYHAWRFNLDGGLAGAPRMQEVAGFHPLQLGLRQLPLTIWHGWVLVNATGNAAPFDEHAGELESLVTNYHGSELRLGARREYILRANWKVIIENYHECYHCTLIHPELCVVTAPDSGDNQYRPGAWVGGTMDLRDGAETMSLDGRSLGVPIDGAPPRQVGYFGIFPNLLLSLHPDYVMAHRLIPVAEDQTRIECSWLFPPEAFERDGFDPSYASDFWDVTNMEDWPACESVQRGMVSPHYRPGPLAPGESGVHHWITMIGRLYQGIPPHRKPSLDQAV